MPDPQAVVDDVKKLLRAAAGKVAAKQLPLLVILISDDDGRIGQALAELEVLETSITEQDRVRFGNLLGSHTEKTLQVLSGLIEESIKQRLYVTGLKGGIESRRLKRVGTELFERVFEKPLTFPFDGFTTARGNAADTCQALTSELLTASLDYNSLIAKPPKVKNRGLRVLRETWGVFGRDGRVSRRPTEPVVRSITQLWDKILKGDTEHFILHDVLSETCLPPHGANIASAGLLLGVFVAPRHEELAIIEDGQQYSIGQWLQKGVFRGKFLDLDALRESELVTLGESSSEWEEFLDEWEIAVTYAERKDGLSRAMELKDRVPVPPALSYRVEHLQDQARQAIEAIEEMDQTQSEALKKIEDGYEGENVNKLTWGAADLSRVIDTMKSQEPFWSPRQIGELEPALEKARQAAIQVFPTWLNRQMPRGDTPDAVGKFKHIMLNLVGKNLKELGMEAEYEQLEEHALRLVRNAETAAEARHLLLDVSSWLDQHKDATKAPRVAELRGLRDVGKDYSHKLQGMSRRIDLEELTETRSRLSEFLAELKRKETGITKRADRLWQTGISSIGELQELLDEMDFLIPAFTGSDEDVDDLHIIRRLLQELERDYRNLQDGSASWNEWNARGEEMKEMAEKNFGEEELPWDVSEVFNALQAEVVDERFQKSAQWTEALQEEVTNIEDMPAPEANRLHAKCQAPPPFLTDQDRKQLDGMVSGLEERLNDLALDWLIERFKELPEASKQKFLKIVGTLSKQD